MKRIALFLGGALLAAAATASAQAPSAAYRLQDLETVFVDETSFKIVSSSCGTRVGGFLLPCEKHSRERVEFLVVLKRWLGKSGFKVVDSRKDADGVLLGDLSMSDFAHAPSINDPDYRKKRGMDPLDTAEWYINAWIENRNGDRIWTIRRGEEAYPGIFYSATSMAKIEGKKLAKALQHDRKKGR
ncbi:MAG TPA: hypothetical protein VK918_01325 [Pyrinomonadaceae bacterium]|nr:hypothetical protein [Pyrinomonadaceae bacterium]